MCLAVPMKIKELREGHMGLSVAGGIENEVNLCLIKEPREGDYVIVHAGFAIEKLDEEEAQERINLFKELAEVMAS